MSQFATLISIICIGWGSYLFYPSQGKIALHELEMEIDSYCKQEPHSFPNTINGNYSSLVACKIEDIRPYPSLYADRTVNDINWGFVAVNQVHPKIVTINDKIFTYCKDYGDTNQKSIASSYFAKMRSIEQENTNRVLNGEINFGSYEKLRASLNSQLIQNTNIAKSDPFCKFTF